MTFPRHVAEVSAVENGHMRMIESVDAAIRQYLFLWDGHASGSAGCCILLTSGGLTRKKLDEALRRSLGALIVSAGCAVVSRDGAMLASTDDASGNVLEGGAERRRVIRRVGQSQHMRRLRRGHTLTTPSGHGAVDVPVSQGPLRLDSSD